MIGLPLGTAFAWFGTPVAMVILIFIVMWIEDQRNMDEWEGDPIDTDKFMKMKNIRKGDKK